MGLDTVEIWENQRWSVRSWKFLPKMLPKVDPPAWCDKNGRPMSIDNFELEMQAHFEAKSAGNSPGAHSSPTPCSKAWRWVDDSKWRCSAWYYAMAFQSSNFKPLKDKTSFVRKRCWTRMRVSIVHPQGALVTARRIALQMAAQQEDSTKTVAENKDSKKTVAEDSTPIHETGAQNGTLTSTTSEQQLVQKAPVSIPRSKCCVRFADNTTFSRLLDNRQWRACAASRNAYRWLQQYIADCNECNVTPLHCAAALLASDGLSAFDKQSQARNILAGEMPWPPDSPATAAATTASTDHDALYAEILAQLVSDTKADGIHAACTAALQTLVMVTINAQHRQGASADSGAHDPKTTAPDIPAQPNLLDGGGLGGMYSLLSACSRELSWSVAYPFIPLFTTPSHRKSLGEHAVLWFYIPPIVHRSIRNKGSERPESPFVSRCLVGAEHVHHLRNCTKVTESMV
eukprot:m.377591 g.377591  ORF g.377591 m.377591 type:complete len:458 (+) comp20925_c0_seq4:299-1672(+)